MEKRKITIGTYDTAQDGLWTLTGWVLGKAEAHTEFADVPGHNGPLDLSTALTDGEPYYGSRPFEATFESSEGTRLEREERIDQMINQLDGWRFDIALPDDDRRHINGRVRVERLYNNLAHASVRVTATCEPWRYNNEDTVLVLEATSAEKTVQLVNSGRRSVVPTIKIEGESVTFKFTVGTEQRTWTLGPGEYILGDIYLRSGSSPFTYSGSGKITFTYREAVL